MYKRQHPEAFEDEGKDEFKGLDKKDKKKAKKSKREKEEAKHAGGVLGMFAVKRVCLRGHRYDIDAFMRKTKTTAKDVQSNIIKMQVCLSVSLSCRGVLLPHRYAIATSRRVASMASGRYGTPSPRRRSSQYNARADPRSRRW